MKVLKLPDVMKACALSRSTIYAYIARNKFPAPIPLGEKAVGWLETEISLWVEERVNVREARLTKASSVESTGHV